MAFPWVLNECRKYTGPLPRRPEVTAGAILDTLDVPLDCLPGQIRMDFGDVQVLEELKAGGTEDMRVLERLQRVRVGSSLQINGLSCAALRSTPPC